MGMLAHVSINLFPLIMLLVIYWNQRERKVKTIDQRQFEALILCTMTLMIVDIFSNGLNGATWQGGRVILWITYIAHVIMLVVVANVWLMYVCNRLHARDYIRLYKGIVWIIGCICAAFVVLALTTPWTYILFTITEEGVYQRSEGYFLSYVVNIGVLLASVLVALYIYRHEVSKELRVESLYKIGCGLFPLVGFAIQNVFPGWWVGGPCVALSILFIYINTQNSQITTDSLTGLNNRGEFDRQLRKKAESADQGGWGLLILDVDDFKAINDNLGHAVGDEALWQTADILRNTFRSGKTFLARYGGDEFALIGNWRNHEEAEWAIEALEAQLRKFNEATTKDYHLSFSVGHALWSETKDEESLIKKADERMYEKKCRKKKSVITSDL